MTKEEALYSFYSQFGTAYEETHLPKSATLPYLTYSVSTASFGDGDTSLSLSVWTRSTSWALANSIAKQISDTLGLGGVIIDCDDGAVWLKRGTPFAQNMGDESDDLIKRKVINITAEYIGERMRV